MLSELHVVFLCMGFVLVDLDASESVGGRDDCDDTPRGAETDRSS